MEKKIIQTPNCRPQDNYYEFERLVRERFDILVEEGYVLFKTDVPKEALWDAYLNSMSSSDARNHYNCNACKHFIHRFGGLAVIGKDGELHSALWERSDFPYFFRPSVNAMRELVEKLIYQLYLKQMKEL